MSDRIILGSGKVYTKEFTGTLPEVATIETDENKIGNISGGATLEYKPSYYEAKDDLGLVTKTIITDEEVIFKTGVMTFDGKTLNKLCETGRVTETAGKRTVKIGGVGNQNGKSYIIHFVHEDKVDGDIRLTIVGKNQAGFALTFAKDKETVIDAEFKALPQDSEGTLIKYEEEIPTGA